MAFVKAIITMIFCTTLIQSSAADTFKIGWISTSCTDYHGVALTSTTTSFPKVSPTVAYRLSNRSTTSRASYAASSALGLTQRRFGQPDTFLPKQQPVTTPKITTSTELPSTGVSVITPSVVAGDALDANIEEIWRNLLLRIERDGLMKGHNLQLLVRNANCVESEAIKIADDYINKDKVHCIVGPVSVKELLAVGFVTAAAKTLHLAFNPISSLLDARLSDSLSFPTMIRVSPTVDRLTTAIVDYMASNDWSRVALLSTYDDSYCSPVVEKLIDNLTADLRFDVTYVRWYDATPDAEQLREDLAFVADVARVIVYCVSDDKSTYDFLQTADKLGMSTSEYVFVLPHTTGFRANKDLTIAAERLIAAGLEGRSWTIVEMAVSEQLLDLPNAAGNHSTRNATNPSKSLAARQKLAAHWHDAMYLYIRALDLVVNRRQQNPADTHVMIRAIKAMHISVGTNSIDIDNAGIRVINVSAYQLDAKTHSTFELTQIYDGIKSIWGSTHSLRKATVTGLSECGFSGELCLEENTMSVTSKLMTLGLIGGLIAMFTLLLAYMANRRLRVSRLSNSIWRIPLSDIRILKDTRIGTQSFNTSLSNSIVTSLQSHGSLASDNSNASGDLRGDEECSNTSLSEQKKKPKKKVGWSTAETASQVGSESVVTNTSMTIGLSALLDNRLRIGQYADQMVVLKPMPVALSNLKKEEQRKLVIMRKLQHPNVAIFYGFAFGGKTDTANAGGTNQRTASNIPLLLMEYGQRGSLRDVLNQDLIKLDAKFKVSLTLDMIEGLMYIHASPLLFHGRMKTTNIIVNKRWIAKLTDYDLLKYRSDMFVSALVSSLPEDTQQDVYKKLLFSAPEVLRIAESVLHPDEVCARITACFPKADIYSLGLCLYELLTEHEPYADMNIPPKDIISRVRSSESSSFRPTLTWDSVLIHGTEGMTENVKRTLVIQTRRCWEENPDNRPDIRAVQKDVCDMAAVLYGKRFNLFERILHELEKYTANLEDIVRDRTSEVQEEKFRSDRLLQRLLPKPIAERMRAGLSVDAELYASVTIMFVDIVNFTAIAMRSMPVQITNLLNTLFSMIDALVDKHNAYKVETISSSYMIASGVPIRNESQHVREVCDLALEIRHHTREIALPYDPENRLQLISGIHTGPCAAGVVGLSMPHYCLFGDAVNTASRMTSTCEPHRIQMSESTHDMLVANFCAYEAQERGTITVKGKGDMRTYWLLGVVKSQRNSVLDGNIADPADEVADVHVERLNTSGASIESLSSGRREMGTPLPGESTADLLTPMASPISFRQDIF